MVDPVVEGGVEDTLQAREADVRARHEAGEYGEADLEILLLRTPAQWALEHPPPRAEADSASASPRPVHNEGDGVNVVDGGSTRVRRVIRPAEVSIGGVQAQVLRSSATGGSLNNNIDGRRQSTLRSGVRQTSATHVSAGRDGGIALTYGYFKISPDKIAGRQQGQRGKSGGGGGWKSSNAKSIEGADRGKSTKGGAREGGGSHREGRRCYICDAPDHLSYDCPDRDESDDDRDANRRKGDGGGRRRDNQLRKEKQASKTSSTKDADSSGGNARGKEASCSMVGVVEPTISLALEAGEDFKAVVAAVHANPIVVLLDSVCSHHLMGTVVEARMS
ncbi:unnamed protein product, partial [Closterium sp. NIES-54]